MYGIQCDKCEGTNIEWSEYEGMIWCYDCEIDTKGLPGVFDGPIPINTSKILGINFDRIDLKTKKIFMYDEEKKKYIEKTYGIIFDDIEAPDLGIKVEDSFGCKDKI